MRIMILIASLFFSQWTMALSASADAAKRLAQAAAKIYVDNYDCNYATRNADIILAEDCGTTGNSFCRARMLCTRKATAPVLSLPAEADIAVACKTDNNGFCPKDPNKCISDNGIVVFKQDVTAEKPELSPRINERPTAQ